MFYIYSQVSVNASTFKPDTFSQFIYSDIRLWFLKFTWGLQLLRKCRNLTSTKPPSVTKQIHFRNTLNVWTRRVDGAVTCCQSSLLFIELHVPEAPHRQTRCSYGTWFVNRFNSSRRPIVPAASHSASVTVSLIRIDQWTSHDHGGIASAGFGDMTYKYNDTSSKYMRLNEPGVKPVTTGWCVWHGVTPVTEGSMKHWGLSDSSRAGEKMTVRTEYCTGGP